MGTQIKVKGIMSFPNLFTPRSITPGDDPKYGVTVLIPNNDPQVAAIQQAVDAEKQNGFPSGFPANGKCCFKPAVEAFPKQAEQLAGYMALSANSDQAHKPQVGDLNMQPVMDPGEVQAGDMAWFSVHIKSYDMPVNKGVGGYINGVMITGEEGALGKLGNTQSLNDMFAGVGDGPAANTAAPKPSSPGAPAPAPEVATVVMTGKAEYTYAQYIAAGHTDDTLINEGLMIAPSFG